SRTKVDGINILGGEPLYHPNIGIIMDLVFALKFKKVTIVTNGTRFADFDFSKDFLSKYNISGIAFSIHSKDSLMESEITQRNGIFEKKISGLENVLKLRESLDKTFSVVINCVSNSINIDSLNEISTFYIDKYNINDFSISGLIMDSKGGLSEDNIQMFVPYHKLTDQILKLDKKTQKRIIVHWTPLCIHKNKGGLYSIRELDEYLSSSCGDNLDNLIYLNGINNAKLDACKECYAYRKSCFGPSKIYTDKYGIGEFESISENEFNKLIK
ncbi:MAG: hypothetical protein PHO80_04970, partial [Candidatus Gracilibacteria bacterium]|nr:hypothetical protein [Candidatus Gracilibacteria bacterium]